MNVDKYDKRDKLGLDDAVLSSRKKIYAELNEHSMHIQFRVIRVLNL